MKFTEKLFGTHSERELKRIYPIVDKIEALRPTMQALPDYANNNNQLLLLLFQMSFFY